jgi:hypothetical protein
VAVTSTLMTETQARVYREAWNAAVKRYSKMSKAQLQAEEAALRAEQGIGRVYGGPHSKDEWVNAVLELRGYTTAKLNETTHVLYHQDGVWVGCGLCEWGMS